MPFSFELYPPRTAANTEALHETVLRLAEAGPDFLSVTYGTGGPTGGRSLEVLRFIREHTDVEPLAHLTCVGNTYAGATELIREFLDAGIRSFLALRGDPPIGSEDDFLGDLESSAQLVQLIDRVQAARAPYEEHTLPGLAGGCATGAAPEGAHRRGGLPNGHPRAVHRGQDVEALLAKQAAGATVAITQLFFHADDYLSFVERTSAAGVTIPILPGIMPITSPVRLRRVLELTGEELPGELAVALEVEPSPEGRREIGIEWASRRTAEVLAGGAGGVHLYAFNQHGSRATRPSILWGDVSRPAPITVDWSTYAQSRSSKPVKGMLTGPVTILAWSFVRDDQPLAVTADQVALALRDEITDLERAGIAIIQVDEPALRELLPLKQADQSAYLGWSVRSFRLATGGAAAATQFHTHLCYSEFGVVIDAIRALDADVTSIEAARSRMEVVADIAASGFDHGIGPGVYDIHSPRVPTVDEIESLLRRAAEEIPDRHLWVNPDCGLKTRGYAETTASLRNIVETTRRVRAEVSVAV